MIKRPSPKHISLAKAILSDSFRKNKTKGQILLEHGYSPKTSLNPNHITETESYQEAEALVLAQMEEEEQKIFKELDRKRKRAPYGVLAMNRKYLRDQIWESRDRSKNNGEKVEVVKVLFE